MILTEKEMTTVYREVPALFLRGEGYRLKGFVQDTAKQGAGAL